MARRNSRRATKNPPKKQLKLDTVFKCPFCAHPDSVECIIDKKERIGSVSCWFCQATYSTTLTVLTEPIDIYHEWFDEYVRINNNRGDDSPLSTLEKVLISCFEIKLENFLASYYVGANRSESSF